jgi:hypothetical protein
MVAYLIVLFSTDNAVAKCVLWICLWIADAIYDIDREIPLFGSTAKVVTKILVVLQTPLYFIEKPVLYLYPAVNVLAWMITIFLLISVIASVRDSD